MKIINLGGKEIRVKATPRTNYIYKKEFKQSLAGDLASMVGIEQDFSKLDDINVLQMIWAMAKTENKNLEPFENWLDSFEYLNLQDVIADVIEVATDATFRGE